MKRKDGQELAETGNDTNDVVTVEPIKTIPQEIFKQKEQVLIETTSFASTLPNVRIQKLSADIAKNNEKLICAQTGIDTSQQILDEKLKELNKNLKREKREH